MADPRIQIGKDAEGNFAIQLCIQKDDPIRPYVLALAQRAAQRVQDPMTGFSYEQAPAEGPEELQEILMGLLSPELRAKFAVESAATREKAMSAMMGGPMGGLLGMMTGNHFQQQSALKANPALDGFRATAGSMKDQLDNMLGDSVFGDHVRSEVQAGAFDDALKSDPE
jgi:hypothetical protein